MFYIYHQSLYYLASLAADPEPAAAKGPEASPVSLPALAVPDIVSFLVNVAPSCVLVRVGEAGPVGVLHLGFHAGGAVPVGVD